MESGYEPCLSNILIYAESNLTNIFVDYNLSSRLLPRYVLQSWKSVLLLTTLVLYVMYEMNVLYCYLVVINLINVDIVKYFF